MPEGIGGLVFSGIEHLAEKSAGSNLVSHDVAQKVIDYSEHAFTLESKLTGKGGGKISKMIKDYGDRKDYHLTKETTLAKATGSTMQPHEVYANASTKARAEVFGSKHQNLAQALAQVKVDHGSFGEAKVKELTDHLSVFFHDEKYPVGKGKFTSQLTNDLSKFKQFQEMDLPLSKFQRTTELERTGKKIGSGAFAYKAGLAHSTQGFVNGFFNSRASSMVKAVGDIFGTGYKGAKGQLIASNALGNELYQEYAQVFNFHGSAISKFMPGTVGEFVHKNYLIPGISAARNVNMVYAGILGKHEAKYAAWAVANGLEKRGSLALSKMGVDWRAVQARGGVLTPEEEQTAMRGMIQNIMFRDREQYKTKFSAATPIGRLVTIFHSYSNMQSKMMVESIRQNLFQLHDPAMMLQQLAALAVVVPTVGNAIYSIDEAWTGKNEHPVDNFIGREKSVYSAHNVSSMLAAVSHMGGFGFASGTINAASRQRLANYMLGAPISAVTEAVGDATKGVTNTPEHPHQADQFYRDLLHDVPSMGIGAWMANEHLPTRTQRDAQRPMTARRFKAAMHRKAHKSTVPR